MAPDGEPRKITDSELDATFPAWLPDGKAILFSAGRNGLWRLDLDGESRPVRIPFVGEDGLMAAVSRPQSGRPSRLVYVRSFEDANIWRVSTAKAGMPASALPAVAISSTRREWMPNLSPDGRRVVFGSDRSGESEIWVSDLDGSNALKLTSMHGAPATGHPSWSPDGEWIVFHSNRELYLVAAGGGNAKNLTNDPAGDSFPSFSRDGKWIYFSSNRGGDRQIWKIPASGGKAVRVTASIGYRPIESPDGAYLYYVEAILTPGSIWRVPSSGGGPPVRLVSGVILGNYAVLDGGIYYIDRPSGDGGIYLIDRPSPQTRLQYFDFSTRKSTTVVGNLGDVDLPLTASQDGRIILYPRRDSSLDDLMLVENFR
jgi:Tol biopolymer transport system component